MAVPGAAGTHWYRYWIHISGNQHLEAGLEPSSFQHGSGVFSGSPRDSRAVPKAPENPRSLSAVGPEGAFHGIFDRTIGWVSTSHRGRRGRVLATGHIPGTARREAKLPLCSPSIPTLTREARTLAGVSPHPSKSLGQRQRWSAPSPRPGRPSVAVPGSAPLGCRVLKTWQIHSEDLPRWGFGNRPPDHHRWAWLLAPGNFLALRAPGAHWTAATPLPGVQQRHYSPKWNVISKRNCRVSRHHASLSSRLWQSLALPSRGPLSWRSEHGSPPSTSCFPGDPVLPHLTSCSRILAGCAVCFKQESKSGPCDPSLVRKGGNKGWWEAGAVTGQGGTGHMCP
ncbi:uncharacterized protein LOC121149348 [Ochotona curzoniae]|uniref:uncharacterized protein LOC121149348 n=1 Tax=Ochotona curzoniae TaxID=130825 RepID=UPI001B347749|nr:uncharacterized protein LOC121149348 [Ochotona curzoniae]